MKATFFLTLAASAASAQNQIITTWFSTKLISEEYFSTSTVLYGSSPITPVPTTTQPIVLATSIITAATASRNINHTSWSTVQVTLPLTTAHITVWTTPKSPPTVTIPGTATTTIYVSPTLATITLSPAICASNATSPHKTVTSYAGIYTPFLWQQTTLPTAFPTAVTTSFRATYSYQLFPFTGTTETYTSTVTGYNYLSTSIVGTVTLDPMQGARGYTRTSYTTTITETQSHWQLPFATRAVTVDCQATPTPTVTYEAKCAPTNLIAERDGRGIGVRVIVKDWTYSFPYIQGLDASACCQLCVENKGCAGSEWRTSKWEGYGGCLLYYALPGGSQGAVNDEGTCGAANGGMEYYGDVHALPRQESFVQKGCGGLKYLGGYDPFCPSCKVE